MIEKNLAASRDTDPDPVCLVPGRGAASDWAVALLRSLGRPAGYGPGAPDPDPACAWAASGAMALSGRTQGPPQLAPAPLASCAQGALRALQLLAGQPSGLEVDGAQLLGERAAALGLQRCGDSSPSGSCRLLPTRGGWLAVNLAREDDRRLLPAWLGAADYGDPWARVAARLRELPSEPALARARLMGLPVAPVARPPQRRVPWFRIGARGTRLRPHRRRAPRVLDLSSLWAGPLCAQLLQGAGARVIKVESVRRPDGARSGPTHFFDLLHSGKRSVALALDEAVGIEHLRALIARADIVVESARPRALSQLGIDAGQIVQSQPGLTWLSITGYGRSEPEANWVAFGDDAGVAAGLTLADEGGDGAPMFCGDAIADPLTGLHAALAAHSFWQRGGGVLLDVCLRDVVACVLAHDEDSARSDAGESDASVCRVGGAWEVRVGGARQPVLRPRARPSPSVAAARLGTDTDVVLRELQAC